MGKANQPRRSILCVFLKKETPMFVKNTATFVVLAVFTSCLVAQPVADEGCDDGPPRVKFAMVRSIEDEGLDAEPYLDVPVDHEVGRAKPMPSIKAGIDTVCPFGVKCDKNGMPISPKSSSGHSSSDSSSASDSST